MEEQNDKEIFGGFPKDYFYSLLTVQNNEYYRAISTLEKELEAVRRKIQKIRDAQDIMQSGYFEREKHDFNAFESSFKADYEKALIMLFNGGFLKEKHNNI